MIVLRPWESFADGAVWLRRGLNGYIHAMVSELEQGGAHVMAPILARPSYQALDSVEGAKQRIDSSLPHIRHLHDWREATPEELDTKEHGFSTSVSSTDPKPNETEPAPRLEAKDLEDPYWQINGKRIRQSEVTEEMFHDARRRRIMGEEPELLNLKVDENGKFTAPEDGTYRFGFVPIQTKGRMTSEQCTENDDQVGKVELIGVPFEIDALTPKDLWRLSKRLRYLANPWSCNDDGDAMRMNGIGFEAGRIQATHGGWWAFVHLNRIGDVFKERSEAICAVNQDLIDRGYELVKIAEAIDEAS